MDNQEENRRKWEVKPKELKTGRFSPEEKDTLIKAVCTYVQSKNLGLEGLQKLVSVKSDKDSLGAWSKIAESLPNRTVQSCHNFCRRAYNPLNYQGEWTQEQEQQLIELVDHIGRKWEKIGQEMGRTAMNVRDKYKNLGEENSKNRVKDIWTLGELAKLIRKVQKKLKADFFLKDEIKQLFKEKPEIKYQKSESNKDSGRYRMRKNSGGTGFIFDSNLQFLSKYIDFEKTKNIEFKNIDWTNIANKLKTKSKDDCRNKWQQIMNQAIFSKSQYDSDDDEKLIDGINEQGVDSETEIDFQQIENGKNEQENKMRWSILKKNVNCRLDIQLPETLKQLVKNYHDKKKLKRKQKKEEAERLKNQQEKSEVENELFDLFKKEYM